MMSSTSSARPSLSDSSGLSSKPIFYPAVIDYYAIQDKNYYENHFFILQIFLTNKYEYKIERSYRSFCELDCKLRRLYPVCNTLPPLPLSGVSFLQKKYEKTATGTNRRRFPLLASKIGSKSKPGPASSGSSGALSGSVEVSSSYSPSSTAENPSSNNQFSLLSLLTKVSENNRLTAVDRKEEALRRDREADRNSDNEDMETVNLSMTSEGWQTHLGKPSVNIGGLEESGKKGKRHRNSKEKDFFQRIDFSENLSQKRLPLTLYLTQLFEIPEIVICESLLNFFDEEIPDSFLYAAPTTVIVPQDVSVESPSPQMEKTSVDLPLSSLFNGMTSDLLTSSLEYYLLFQKECPRLLNKKLGKETFSVSFPIKNGTKKRERLYYLFYTDYYDIALSISYEESCSSSVDVANEPLRESITTTRRSSRFFRPSSVVASSAAPDLTSSVAITAASEDQTPTVDKTTSIILSPYQRYASHQRVIHGFIDLSSLSSPAEEEGGGEGIVTFQFDNSYSKWRSKNLHYIIKPFSASDIEENMVKVLEIINMKNDFQQKRITLKNCFSSLSEYLVASNGGGTGDGRRLSMIRREEKDEEEDREGKGDLEREGSDSSIRRHEKEKERSGDSSNPVKSSSTRNSESSENEETETRRDDEHDGLATSEIAENTLEDLMGQGVISTGGMSLEELLEYQRSCSSFNSKERKPQRQGLRKSSSSASPYLAPIIVAASDSDEKEDILLEKEKDQLRRNQKRQETLFQQLTQKEYSYQLQLLQEKKQRLAETLLLKDAQLNQKENDYHSLEEAFSREKETTERLQREYEEMKVEMKTIREEYDQMIMITHHHRDKDRLEKTLGEWSTLVDGEKHDNTMPKELTIDEILSFSSFEEFVDSFSIDSVHSSSLSSSSSSQSLTISNVKSLFTLTKSLSSSYSSLLSSYQSLQSIILPKVKNEKKQLKQYSLQLKEENEQLKQEIAMISHEKDLLIFENKELKEQATVFTEKEKERVQQQQQQQQSFSNAPISSSFSSSSSASRQSLPVVPERITITKEDLYNIVVDVHEITLTDGKEEREEEEEESPNFDIIIKEKKETIASSNALNLQQQDGKLEMEEMENVELEVDSFSSLSENRTNRESSSSMSQPDNNHTRQVMETSSLPTYIHNGYEELDFVEGEEEGILQSVQSHNFIDTFFTSSSSSLTSDNSGSVSEKKLIKVDFSETAEDDITMAMNMMSDAFNEMTSNMPLPPFAAYLWGTKSSDNNVVAANSSNRL
jgi:hypothetical protein